MTSKILIFALHGFLGLPKDFDEIDLALPRGTELVAVDYTLNPKLNPSVPLVEWGQNFNRWVSDYLSGRKDLEVTEIKKILLGYSQGGRLALQALINDSSLWQLAVIVSANPGISENEKADRRLSDKNWALKFISQDFKSVVSEWNNQAVFNGSEEPQRLVEDYERAQLAAAVENWSVANQEDLRVKIKSISTEILWVSGERDLKYTAIAKEMSRLNSRIQAVCVTNAGHRVLFDRPKNLASFLK